MRVCYIREIGVDNPNGIRSAMDVEEGVRRLQEILPLKARQSKLPERQKILHRAILGGFAGNGAPLGAAACRVVLGGENVRRALTHLAGEDLIVLAHDGAIQGAYPFTTAQTPHRVTLRGHTLNAMCALDALAVAPMFATEAVVDSVCDLTGTLLHVEQSGSEWVTARPTPSIHVGIQWGATEGAAAHSL